MLQPVVTQIIIMSRAEIAASVRADLSCSKRDYVDYVL